MPGETMRPIVRMLIFAFAAVLVLGGWRGLGALLDRDAPRRTTPPAGDQAMSDKIRKTDREWKAALSREQYEVMR